MTPPSPEEKVGTLRPQNYPYGWPPARPNGGGAMALLALAHTPVEHRLYQAMLGKTSASRTQTGAFSVRRLMELTGLPSYSTVRRGRDGLVEKSSIERQPADGGGSAAASVYRVYAPEEALSRLRSVEREPYPEEARRLAESGALAPVLARLKDRHGLSRSEVPVAICCLGGMTNAEIGERLCVSVQTVKFHLRHIFVKCGVRRRAELISQLLGGFAAG